MNIAFLTPEYVTESNFDGGLANYLHRVAQGMKSRGHNVEIFTISDKNESIFNNGIVVNRVKLNNFIVRFINCVTFYRFSKSVHVLLSSYFLRKSLIKRNRHKHFDIIQASSFLACGLLSTFNRPSPIITRVSSYEPLWRKYYHNRLTYDQRLAEWLEMSALHRSDAVYGPSESLSNILRQKEGMKIDVLRPPFLLETEDFDDSIYKRYLSGKKYLIFFGTIGLLKGGGVLAQVIHDVLSQNPDIYFVFVGKDTVFKNNNSMMQHILKKAGSHKNRIIHITPLDHSQLYPVVKHSHAVVLPSLVDNLPNTMLEAMTLGKVVIGTKGTSFEEMIDDKVSGIIVESNNKSELYQAIEKVLKMDDRRRQNIGNAAQKKISLLSPEVTCRKLEQYFERFTI